jgi:hypothetical protein
MKETDLVEGRALQSFYSSVLGNVDKGRRIRVTVAHARHLTSLGNLELDPIPTAGPKETKPAGPDHTKDLLRPLRRAEGFPVNLYSTVNRAWLGATALILAGGPSLVDGDGLERARARKDRAGNVLRIIAINNAYRVAPQADLLYYADARWHEWHADKPAYQAFHDRRVTVEGGEGVALDAEAYRLHIDTLAKLSRDPKRLAHGGNAGYQAINLAALLGVARIVLLGYDMKRRAGATNWHSEHKAAPTPERGMRQWIINYRDLAAELKRDGVEVINATESTALDAFPRRPIAELLPDPA